MSIDVRPATLADVPAIRAFNGRVAGTDEGFSLPESPHSLGLARGDGAPVWHEIFVASESGGAIRGGYALKRELLSVANEILELHNYQIPLSEGIVDRGYATLGIRLLQDAAARHARLYCLGMGNLGRPLPRLLERFKWTVEEVPFRFRVLRASDFLRNIEFLRANRLRRVAIDMARFSGAGALGVLAWRTKARLLAPTYPKGFAARDVASFGAEADDIFATAARHYGALIDRTAAALAARFPASDPRLLRVIAHVEGEAVGWLVLTRNQLRGHRQFGNMRLGSIVDGLCDPVVAPALVRHGIERLDRERVDLVVTNQTHRAWLDALACNAFMAGPSNFILARSPALAASTPALQECHVNRGDGDGPINL